MNQQLDELDGFKPSDHVRRRRQGLTNKGAARKSFTGSPTKGTSTANVVFKKSKSTHTDEIEGYRCRILKVHMEL
eukprot:gnl/Chilomastix_caulleri/2963.p2 GENE.gnl/Chilomastix_caulleri/2963~~gnl/Chilomastix_caulleri/2963.p2  ORF type:complete len:75 (+),score=11.62 gnl/Chilomastix_caulleri/2963:50-274(+)